MAKTDDNLTKLWFQVLTSGMVQGTDTSLAKGGQVLKNVTTEEQGNYATRSGSDLIGASLGTNQGYGLWEYNPTDGTRKLFAVTDRDLYALNETTNAWASVDTDEWTVSKKVDGVDFLNRSYIGCESGTDPLCYTTGSAVVDIVPTIGGGIMAVNKDILVVAGNSILPNVAFYTDPFTDKFHSVTGTCAANADVGGTNYLDATTGIFTADIEGKIIYNTTEGKMLTIVDWISSTRILTNGDTSTWDNDTIYVMKNVAKHDGKITAMEGYQDNFVSFDSRKMYVWDPTSEWSSKYKDYGCINDRVLQICGGWLIWVAYDGIYKWNGSGLPEDISKDIKNNVNGFGVWNLINKSNLLELCAGSKNTEGKYYLSVGTLNTVANAPCSAESNVVLVYDIVNNSWSYRTYPDQIVAFSTFINDDNEKDLYGICKNDAYVIKLDSGTLDDGSTGSTVAISSEVKLPHHQLVEDPTVTVKMKQYYVKYICDASVTVSVSVDRGSYTTLTTLDSSSTVKTIEINPIPNTEGMTFSLKFATTGKLVLEGYGFLIDTLTTTRLPKK